MDNTNLPGTVTKVCEICGKEFNVYRYKLKRGGGKYCSNECKTKAKTTRQKRICEYCGNEFEAHTYLIQKGGGKYCSKSCYHAASRHNIKCNCIICGKEFTINKSQLKEGRGRYCSIDCACNGNCGENHHAWKGGITTIAEKIRKSNEYMNWRSEVFRRDEYRCQNCGSKHKLNAHHIIKFSYILNKNMINSFKDALLCEDLWDISNGITYCEGCHNILHGLTDKDSTELYMRQIAGNNISVHKQYNSEEYITLKAEDFLKLIDNKNVIDLGFI
jgi:hypothetical protein